ncbi:hypothetical protein V1522DRAFT_415059 [Lipomyces starkeyi]
MSNRPAFEALPLKEDHPPYSAWGLYGEHDELGSLNLLTQETVLAAKSEIETGTSISLNLPLNVPIAPMNPDRGAFKHRFIVKPFSNDEEVVVNTQSSSQWDGLRHFPYQASKTFYGGFTQDDISGPAPTTRGGVHNLARKAIAGRGVLLDFRSWANNHGIHYDAFSTYRITLDQLLKCAEEQGTEFRVGDILLIRSGWVEDYYRRSHEERLALRSRAERTFAGVENSLEIAKWHWETGFAAVAGDTNAYEAWPPERSSSLKHALHEVFLSGWGMPIGELWNMEELAAECKRRQKWSFFLTSQPLDIPGGVASPCNAMAVF